MLSSPIFLVLVYKWLNQTRDLELEDIPLISFTCKSISSWWSPSFLSVALSSYVVESSAKTEPACVDIVLSLLWSYMLRTITVLGLWSLLVVFLLYQANSNIVQNLSPQGCRMSWMSPSYRLQTGFDTTLSPLASRYSLWLYREVGWDPVQVCLFSGSF